MPRRTGRGNQIRVEALCFVARKLGSEALGLIIQELTACSQMTALVRATKRALWGALEHGLTDACRAGAQELVGMWGHPDQEEGPLAFAERREARWSVTGSEET